MKILYRQNGIHKKCRWEHVFTFGLLEGHMEATLLKTGK